VVLCPSCGAEVAEGHSICPYCDELLDDSFLDDAAEREADPSRPTQPEIPAMVDEDRDTDEMPARIDPGPAPAPSPAPRRKRADATRREDYDELHDAFGAVTDRLQNLTLFEKIGSVAAFVVFAGSLLPWLDRGKADWLIGTDLGGWFNALGGLVSVVLILLLPRSKLAGVATAAVGALSLILAFAAMAKTGSAAIGLYLTLLGGAAMGATGVLSMLPGKK